MGFIRRVFQILIVILIILLMPLTLMGIWTHVQVYNEEKFVESVDNLYADPDVQQAIAIRLSAAVEDQVGSADWETFAERVAINDTVRAELVGLDTEIGPFIQDHVDDVLNSPAFEEVWVAVVREAHPLVTQVLKGENTELTQTTDGTITLDFAPIFEQLTTQLEDQGIDLTQVVDLDPDELQLTVYQGDELIRAQEGIRLFNDLLVFVVIALAVLALVLVLVSRAKLGALAAIGLAVAVGMAVEILVLFIARRFLGNAASTDVDERAAQAIFDEFVALLWRWSLIGLAVGGALFLISLVLLAIRGSRPKDVYIR